MPRPALAFALALALLAPAARADDARREESRAAFRRGVELAQRGSLAEARDAFVEAYRLFPHPSILLNLGLLRARTGEYVEAEQDLVHFLADDGGATRDEVQGARAALADARAHLGTLRLKVEPASARAALDGAPLALAPGQATEVRMATGEHGLRVSADGYKTETLAVRGDARAPTVVELSLGRDEAPSPRGGGSGARTAVGATLVAAGGVAVVVGLACGARAIALADGYNDRTSDDWQKPGVKSDGLAFRAAADVAIVSGLVLAAAGVGFLFWPSPRAQVTFGPGSVRVAF